MKSLPLASLALVASLSLTSCASSPSLEDQAKLIEYEMCLEMSVDEYNRTQEEVMDLGSGNWRIEKSMSLDYKKAFESRLNACKHLRP